MRLNVPARAASSPRARFLGLQPAHREIIIAASVVGSTFSIGQVSRITEQRESDVLEALQRALELGLVSDTGDSDLVSFESEAYETIRKLVLTPRVRALQSRVAQDMEQRLGDPAETAERWLAAGEKAKACAAYERAGDRCFAAGDDREAQRLFRSALNESAEDAEKSRLRGKIADAAVRAGRPVDAVLVARAQLASLENRSGENRSGESRDVRELAERLLHLSRLLWTTCEADEAIAQGERILSLPKLERSVLDEARAWLAYILAIATRVEAAESQLAALRGRTLGSSLRAAFHEVEFIVAAKRGDAVAAVAAFEKALAAARGSALIFGRIRNNFIFETGPLGRAPAVAAAITRIDARTTNRAVAIMNLGLTLGEAALMRGELSLAAEYVNATAALDVTGARHHALRRGLELTIKTLLGDRSAATGLVDEADLEGVIRSREPRLIAPVVVPHCETLSRTSNVGAAQELLGRALRATGAADAPFWLELLAARIGTIAEIHLARRHLRESAQRRRDEVATAALLLFDAIVAARSGDRSERPLRKAARAAALFRNAGWRLHEAEAFEYAGQTAAAAAIYREVGAYSELRRLRIPTGRSRFARKLGLTERQREICRLAGSGASNAAVAAQLGLGEKTVAHHLSAAYQRLGIRSRWQLRAALEAETSAPAESRSPS